MTRRKLRPLTGFWIYLRVSTGEQAKSGLGSAAQLARCEAHAAERGVPVLGVLIDDGRSGRLDEAQLPGLTAARAAAVGAPGSALLVYALSRYDRDGRRVAALLADDEAVSVYSATQPLDTSTAAGRLVVRMFAAVDAHEVEQTGERTAAALAVARERGVVLGRPRVAARVLPELRAFMVELKAGGHSARGIARLFNAAGIPSVSGASWWERTVREALR